MKKKITLITAATLSLLLLSGCGVGKNSNATIKNPRQALSANKLNGSTSINKTQTGYTSAAPAGKKPEMNAAWHVVSDISPTCATLLAPFRAIEKEIPQGINLTKTASASQIAVLNKAMSIAQNTPKVCSSKDFQNWYNNEYLGWSRTNK